jgi:hypothetical protein
MKKNGFWIMVFFIQIIILPWTVNAQDKNESQNVDLAVYKIENPAVTKYLKTDKIKVRRFSYTDRPEEPLPVIKLRETDNSACEERLNKILKIFGHEQVKIQKEKNTLFSAKNKDFACWLHQASGGFKYTAKRTDVAKSSFRDFKEAVNTALDFIEKTKIVRLVEGEEMDILAVSTINNAVASVEKSKNPQELFISDYYVSFGRRFKGIPIVGSYLVFRFNYEKKPVMIKMNWREIAGSGEIVIPMKKDINEILLNQLKISQNFSDDKMLKDFVIIQMQSGYIEAPLNFKQTELRPGSLVSFKMSSKMDEEAAQLVLPLEEKYAFKSIMGEIME